jgi:hypothetical protein
VVLERKPKARCRCPHCQEWIRVKRLPGQAEPSLLTVAQAEQAEKEWEERQSEQRKEEIGRLQRDVQSGTSHERKMAFHRMAVLALSNGEDAFSCLRQARRAELQQIREEGRPHRVRRVQIVGDRECSKGMESDGRVLLIADALRGMPIPRSDCEAPNRFCRCYYEMVFDDEVVDGRSARRPSKPGGRKHEKNAVGGFVLLIVILLLIVSWIRHKTS